MKLNVKLKCSNLETMRCKEDEEAGAGDGKIVWLKKCQKIKTSLIKIPLILHIQFTCVARDIKYIHLPFRDFLVQKDRLPELLQGKDDLILVTFPRA